MRSLLIALPGLGCALMMGGMMWLMSRGNKTQASAPDQPVPGRHDAELADLRSEVERLRAQVRARDEQADPTA